MAKEGYGEIGADPMIKDVQGVTPKNLEIINSIDNQVKNTTIKSFLDVWWTRMGENARLNGNGRKVVADFTIPEERNKETVVIVNPGASMKPMAERIKELREVATIVTIPTAAPWTVKQGLEPDFVVSVDSNSSQIHLLRLADVHVPVIVPTTIDPRMGQEHDCYWFTPYFGNGSKDANNEYAWWDWPARCFDHDLDWGYQSMGCVTNMAVQIVKDLMVRGVARARRIVLLGADYGAWQGFSRCPPWGDENWPRVINPDDWVDFPGGLTSPQMIIYKMNLIRFWQITLMKIYTLSDGILWEFPKVTIDDVLEGNYPDYPDKATVNHLAWDYFNFYAEHFPIMQKDHAERVDSRIAAGEETKYSPGEKHADAILPQDSHTREPSTPMSRREPSSTVGMPHDGQADPIPSDHHPDIKRQILPNKKAADAPMPSDQ